MIFFAHFLLSVGQVFRGKSLILTEPGLLTLIGFHEAFELGWDIVAQDLLNLG